MRTLEERFWAKVLKTRTCWIWTGARSRWGYGKINVDRRFIASHRLSYQWANGEIPPGLWVLHSCDNPPCVRPLHLHLGTPADNNREMLARDRHQGAMQTHCVNGHRFNEANTYWRADRPNTRQCRECNRLASAKYNLKRGARGN